MKDVNSSDTQSLSARDAWEDYLSIRRALANDDDITASVPVSASTLVLVKELVEAGVCESEVEVVGRAIRSFFVAVYPRTSERERVLREAADEYQTRSPDK